MAQWRGDRGDAPGERWVATAREAAKQARRAWLPVVAGAPDESTATVARRLAGAAAGFVLHEEAEYGSPLSSCPADRRHRAGGRPGGRHRPGGAGRVRRTAAPVRLGREILRTSTAGVAALAVLSARLGRW